MITLDDGLIMTLRFPLFSALYILLRASFNTLTLTMVTTKKKRMVETLSSSIHAEKIIKHACWDSWLFKISNNITLYEKNLEQWIMHVLNIKQYNLVWKKSQTIRLEVFEKGCYVAWEQWVMPVLNFHARGDVYIFIENLHTILLLLHAGNGCVRGISVKIS